MSTPQSIGNRYEIADLERDLLGRGGVGDVYRGTDLHTGRSVAIKALDRKRSRATPMSWPALPAKAKPCANWITTTSSTWWTPFQVGVHAIGNIDRTIYRGAYPDGSAIRFESFQLWSI